MSIFCNISILVLRIDRICPGRFFAENMVWLAIARILAAFNVTKARDAEGNEIEHEVKFVTGITRCVSC